MQETGRIGGDWKVGAGYEQKEGKTGRIGGGVGRNMKKIGRELEK